MYTEVIRPALFHLSDDPEDAHEFAFRSLEALQHVPLVLRAVEMRQRVVSPRLQQVVMGIPFDNPVGLAAGMDKNGRCLRAWQALGFGFIEAGTITSLEQPGHPRPRIRRYLEQGALRNWLGFNNYGADRAAKLIAKRRRGLGVPLGINIGKSKLTPMEREKVNADYAYTVGRLYPYASYIVINVSSPNTEGVRDLAAREELRSLVRSVKGAIKECADRYVPIFDVTDPIPVLVKPSPDMSDEQLDDFCDVCAEEGIDGVIATNTTILKDGLPGVVHDGGTSGLPVREKALRTVRFIRRRLPKMPIIGVGGINSGQSAFEMFVAGANLVQCLTGLVYEGPDLPRRINAELLEIMDTRGINHVNEIYGS